MSAAQTGKPRKRLRTIVIGAVAAAGVTTAGWWVLTPRTLYGRLAAIAPERSIVPQTSLSRTYSGCAVTPGDSLVLRSTCARHSRLEGAEVQELLLQVKERLDEASDPDALHARGMLALYGIGDTPPNPGEAIAYLDSALQFTHDSASVMSDLAAAYMVLAEQQQSPLDLLYALEWSDHAIELDSLNRVALFNRALALEGLMADISAREAWKAYLAAEAPIGFSAYLRRPDRTRWRREAEQRLRNLAARGSPIMPPDNAGPEAWGHFVARYPQMARKRAWETLLPAWGEAVERGDAARADTLLRAAEVIGKVVAARSHGDSSVSVQVAAIRALATSGPDLANVARAHRVEKQIKDRVAQFDNGQVDSLLSQLRVEELPIPQKIWIGLRRAAVLLNRTEWDEADDVLDEVDARADSLRYPAAVGYSRWLRATKLVRHEASFGRAVEIWESAEELFARTGEPASRAAVHALLADAQALAGNLYSANDWSQRALRTINEMGPSPTVHAARRVSAVAARAAGLPRAMRDMANEDVAVADTYGNPAYLDEALLNRAALFAGSGNRQLALYDLARTSPPDLVKSAIVDEFNEAARAYTKALLQLDSSPDSVAATVVPLLAYRGARYWPVTGYALRARAAAILGDAPRARADLDTVFTSLAGWREQTGGAALQQGVTDVRPALTRVVRLLAERGDTTGALDLLQRGASALSPIRIQESSRWVVAPRRMVIRPLLANGTLYLWTVKGGRVSMLRAPLDSARVASSIQRVAASLPYSSPADAELSYLYRVLVQPVEGQLEVGDEVVFVHDAELGPVPFAALLNRRGEPLVRYHPVSTAVNIAAATVAANTTFPRSVAFFAPPFDLEENPGLDSLPDARREVASVSPGYGSRVTGFPPTPEGFLAALAGAEVLHFAGHAIADPFRPEHSYLVLSRAAGSATGHLLATQLDSRPASQVRLVVLSACSTLGDGTRASESTGLSGALLNAGVHSVLGTLWRVDDKAAHSLMVRFHESYRRSRDPARALWEAQRIMLDAGKPPKDWAAFQYVFR